MLKVSIIIPVKPDGPVAALAPLSNAGYPEESFEILVAEGTCPSVQRNSAAAVAEGDILYFLDDDSLATPGFLSRAVSHYTDATVAAVGGPSLTPASDSPLQQAFAMAFAGLIGGGGMRNRYRATGSVRSTTDHELILCNLSFCRDVFMKQGGFNPRLYPNEENELMERILQSGGILIHDPDLAIYRSQRRTLGAFCRQLFGYGRGRGEQTLLSGVVRPITCIPSVFCLYLLLLPFVRQPLYSLPLVIYATIILFFTLLKSFSSGRPAAAVWLMLVIPLFHLCYGVGMIRGLVMPRGRFATPSEADVAVRRIKGFGEAIRKKM